MNRNDYIEWIPHIQRLFRSAFEREISASYLEWRYADNLDLQSLVTTEKSNGQLVAHYASTPLKMNVGGQKKRATLTALVMTDAQFRGQGLFQRIAAAHEAELKRQGFSFTYGFPNRKSDPIFLARLAWLPIYEIPSYYLDLAGLQHVTPDMGPVVFDDHFERFNYDAFVDRCGLICQFRDTEFLRWRYAKHPLNRYCNLAVADGAKLTAYGVCKIYAEEGRRQLDLVDYFACDRPALRVLVRAVCKYAIDNGCPGVNTWSPRHHFSHQYLSSIGFGYRMPVTNMGFKSLDDNLTPELRQFSNWWVTMGDSDVY